MKQKNIPLDPMLTPAHVCKELGISAPTLSRWEANGTIPKGVVLGGKKRWRRSVIEAAKDGRTVVQAAA
jgi:predicted DNA-binding transcriptional regulator AlpA